MYGVRSQTKIYPWGDKCKGTSGGFGGTGDFLFLNLVCECIHTINLRTFRYTCYIL